MKQPFKTLKWLKKQLNEVSNLGDINKKDYQYIFKQNFKDLEKTPFELIVEKKEFEINWKTYEIYNYRDNDSLSRLFRNKYKTLDKKDEYVNALGNIAATNKIIRLFRNLIVHNWKVIHIFDQRFLNLHEYNNLFAEFDSNNINWNHFVAFEKLDWSLLNIFKHKWKVLFSSKSTIFDKNNLDTNVARWLKSILKKENKSFKDLISVLNLDKYNYSFELVSNFTQVVVNYDEENFGLYSLIIRQKNNLKELTYKDYIKEMKRLSNKSKIFKTVKTYKGNKDEVFKQIPIKERYNWEGVVMRNINKENNNFPKRIKVKPKEYFLTKIFQFANLDIAKSLIDKVCWKINDPKYQKKLRQRLEYVWEKLDSTDLDKFKKMNWFRGLENNWSQWYKKQIKKLKKLSLNSLIYELMKKYQWDIEEKTELKNLLGIKWNDPNGNKMKDKLKKLDKNVDKYKDSNDPFIKKYIESRNNIKKSFDIALNQPWDKNLPINKCKGKLIGGLKSDKKNNTNIKEVLELARESMRNNKDILEYVESWDVDLEKNIIQKAIEDVKEKKWEWYN